MPSAKHHHEKQTASPLKNSFFRAVAYTFKHHQLGDLLVLSGIINSGQLENALAEQKKSKEQLGKILVRHGAVSSAQLYRKLAEQWCIRTSAAGIAIIMQTVSPSASYASNMAPAAHFTAAAAETRGSFNVEETRSDDITPFKKWTGMMARFEEQTKALSATAPRLRLWNAEIRKLTGKPHREQIEGINAFFNGIRYIEDNDNYGKGDYWATPIEFLSRGGDCEDYAIAKYASLLALGFSADKLRVAIVEDQVKKIPHAVLIVYSDDGTFILDNQNEKVEAISSVTRYKPVFALNSASWWLYKA